MTLHRSILLPSSLADIASGAIAGQGQYGAVTTIANEHDLSRQSVYRIRERGQQALIEAFSAPARTETTIEVNDAHIQRSIVAIYTVAPSSIDDIVDLIPIVYTCGTRSALAA